MRLGPLSSLLTGRCGVPGAQAEAIVQPKGREQGRARDEGMENDAGLELVGEQSRGVARGGRGREARPAGKGARHGIIRVDRDQHKLQF